MFIEMFLVDRYCTIPGSGYRDTGNHSIGRSLYGLHPGAFIIRGQYFLGVAESGIWNRKNFQIPVPGENQPKASSTLQK